MKPHSFLTSLYRGCSKGVICTAALIIAFCIFVPVWSRPSIAASQKPKPADLIAAIRQQQQADSQLSGNPLVAAKFAALSSDAERHGSVRVIVTLRVAFRPEGELRNAAEMQAQRGAIRQRQDAVLNRLEGYDPDSLKVFEFTPHLAFKVHQAGLETLSRSPDVIDIHEDKPQPLALAQSVPLVGAPTAWASGYSGAGKTIAILDTGVDKFHAFLAGKVVSEACYSTDDAGALLDSLCPGGVRASTSVNAGLNCTGMNDCVHGTHVAGIAAGKGEGFSGVARDASLISIQVFTRINDAQSCQASGRTAPCLLTYPSDQMSALGRVFQLRNSFSIASVNMSLGGGFFGTYCDTDPVKAYIDQLRSVGIATIASAGNNGYSNGIGSPACISSAVSVGATGDGFNLAAEAIPSFSNSASFLSLLAPGNDIVSSVPNGNFASLSGTSMAAPHVAGAWAILKQGYPDASVSQVLGALTASGAGVFDPRNGITRPNLKISIAGSCINNVPSDSWRGDYFNRGTGSLVMTRDDGAGFINFNWGLGSPNAACGLPADNFSVRFTRTINFADGVYRFVASGDDGVRLFVDGQLRIDGWVDQSETAYAADVALPTGNHELRFEYYEGGGNAVARLSWSRIGNLTPPPDIDSISPGSVTVNQQTTLIVNGSNFQTGFSAAVITQAGLFPIASTGLTFVSSTQVRVQVTMGSVAPYSATLRITNPDGQNTTGTLNVASGNSCFATVSPGVWRGDYFANRTLSGSPAMVRDEGGSGLNLVWGAGSPNSDCGLGTDNFSVRFTRTVNLTAGVYRFSISGDDGVRLYIDGQLRINGWVDQSETVYSADVALLAGNHEFRFEYYEGGGNALARLSGVQISNEIPGPVIGSISPDTLTINQATTLTVNGTNFQPGLSAAVITTAGTFPLSNTAVTFVNSTQVRVQLTMVGTPPYPATLRMTNPDGQSATGAFQVVGGSVNNCAPLAMSVGQTVSGELTAGDCRSGVRGTSYLTDRYSFSGTAGRRIAIRARGFDTFLYLIGPNNTVIASDDDSGGDLGSRIPGSAGYLTLPMSGTYTIEVTSYGPNETGDYSLMITEEGAASGVALVGEGLKQADSTIGADVFRKPKVSFPGN